MRISAVVLALVALGRAGAADRFFAGALGGVATLSADARFEVPQRAGASGYKPENGPAACILAGRHFNDYLSLQASYVWNQNTVRYHALRGDAFYDQRARTSHHLALAEALLYFRRRVSWARPYLAAGTGIAYGSSRAEPPIGAIAGAPGNFSEHSPVLHVAVGIDLELRRGWKLRYSFGESIQSNLFSQRLTPPGERNLAGFRNLFGIVKYF
jgi:hypothetical protein